MPDGFKLGSAWVDVVPNTDGFSERLKAAIDRDKVEATIGVRVDAGNVKAAVEKAAREAGATATVGVKVDAGRLKSEVEAKAKAADATSKVTVRADTKSATDSLSSFAARGSEMFRPMLAAAAGLGPALLPITAVVGTSMASMAAPIAVAGAGLFGFGEIAKAVLTPAATAASQVEKAQSAYNTAIESGTSKSKAYAAEQKAVDAATQGMSRSQRSLVTTIVQMHSAWGDVTKSVTPLVSGALVPWIHALETGMKAVLPFVRGISPAIRDIGQEVSRSLSTHIGDIKNFANAFGSESGKLIRDFAGDVKLLATGARALIQDAAPAFRGAGDGIHHFVQSFTAWATSQKAADQIHSFLAWVHQMGPQVKTLLGDLGRAAGSMAAGFKGMSGGSLTVVETLLNLVAKLSPGQVQALAVGYASLAAAFKSMQVVTGVISAFQGLTKAIDAVRKSELLETVALKAMYVWDGMVAAATKAWEVVQIVFNAVMDANPIGLVIIALAALGAAIYELVTHWRTVTNAVRVAWDAIKNATMVAVRAVEGFVKDAWKSVESTTKTVWNAIRSFFVGLWHGIENDTKSVLNTLKGWVLGIWHGMENDAKAVWNAVKGFFSSFWNDEVRGWKNILNMLKGWVLSIWHGMENDVHTVWNRISGWFNTFWNGLKRGFQNTVNGIKSIWDTVENVAKKPVQFIVNTVYDKGIVPFWNDIASAVHLPKLSALHFAGGGIIPGYNPGVDDVPAVLSRGEAVLTPGAAMELGHDTIEALNARNQPGRGSSGVQGGKIHAAFGWNPATWFDPANWSGVAKKFGSDMTSWGKDAWGAVRNLAGDALATAANTVLKPLLNAIPTGNTTLGNDIKDLPVSAINAFANWIRANDVNSDGAVGSGSGSQVAQYAKGYGTGRNHPYVTGGATPSGWDCSGFSAWVYEHFGYFPEKQGTRHGTSESQWTDSMLQPSGAVPGALAFFDGTGYAPPGHVGVVLNPNSFVSAYDHAEGTVIKPIKGSGGRVWGYRVPKGGFKTGSLAGVSNSSARAALQSAAAKMGWTGAQWAALNNVEMREARYNIHARNASSGAYGMAQFINGPSEYAQYGGNANTAAGQAVAMVNYIKQRYGNPEKAWAHEQSAGWYAGGGFPRQGQWAMVGEQGPELVRFGRSPAQVYSNPASERMMQGSGGVDKIVNIEFTGMQYPTPQQIAQLKMEMSNALEVV